MSVATLKKKAEAKYNLGRVASNNGLILHRVHKSIGNDTVFSLNGTRRSQGYVGQDTLGRSLPKTLMRGNVIRGHGGCCGKYPVKPIVQSAVISTNDPKVVKSSVLGTSGMISTQYAWIERPQPYTTVKPDNNQNNNTQSDYITYLVDKTLNDNEYAVSDTLLVYPPLNPANTKLGTMTINSGNITLSNLEYGNGSYNITLSEYSINGFAPFYIDNTSTTTINGNRWQPRFYTTLSSIVNGSQTYSLNGTRTTIVSGISYNGHWAEIEFPFKINLQKYSFIAVIDGGNNIIYNFVLAGSNNNTDWTLLDNNYVTDFTWYKPLFYNINSTTAYKKYRFIIISAFDTYPALTQLQFYSYDKYYCEKDEKTTTINTCNNSNNKIKTCTTNKPGINYNYAIQSGEYIRRLINCRTKDNHFYVASTNNKQPFTGFN